MNAKEILEKYVKSFRLECHFLLDGVDPNSKEMPVDIYNRAYNNAKAEIIELFKPGEDELSKIDAIHKTFIIKVVEVENYNLAERYILKVISHL